ncbi:XdhC family protein [Paenibacillus sp.]|uniref:XdhC family protein n=1 Tax=Paenibacillus sp. TaxID=58172 RepID=UPI0028326924|nr:XdhC family protein [Paenibacillus sp.]MDR0269942.1 XdhC family protein [Paenibacillus sp.]
MEDIHRILEAIKCNNKRSVLATITHVEGSAYRKEGATMLFFEDGSQIGVLSTGCLEADLAARVPDILEIRSSCGFRFDLQSSDPLTWGEETGCGGVVHVAMEPVDNVLLDHLCILKDYLDRQTEVMLIKKINPDLSVSDYGFVTENRDLFGEWRGEFPQDLLDLKDSVDSQKSGMKQVPPLNSDIFIHTYHPKPRLIIFGAGQDARPLASFAAATGFSVIVADWRPVLCDRKYFPDAEALLLGFPEETVDRIHFTSKDFVVVMTHNFRRDQELIRFLSGRQLSYLGILGSKRRTKRLLSGGSIPANLHFPVGLAIGADGPEEIAVSIVAELVQTYRKNRTRSCCP